MCLVENGFGGTIYREFRGKFDGGYHGDIQIHLSISHAEKSKKYKRSREDMYKARPVGRTRRRTAIRFPRGVMNFKKKKKNSLSIIKSRRRPTSRVDLYTELGAIVLFVT